MELCKTIKCFAAMLVCPITIYKCMGFVCKIKRMWSLTVVLAFEYLTGQKYGKRDLGLNSDPCYRSDLASRS